MKKNQSNHLLSMLTSFGRGKSNEMEILDANHPLMRRLIQFTALPPLAAMFLALYFIHRPRRGDGVSISKILQTLAARYSPDAAEKGLEFLLMRKWGNVRFQHDNECDELFTVDIGVEYGLEEQDARFLPDLNLPAKNLQLRRMIIRATALRRNPKGMQSWVSYVLYLTNDGEDPFLKHLRKLDLGFQPSALLLFVTAIYINDRNSVDIRALANLFGEDCIEAMKLIQRFKSTENILYTENLLTRCQDFFSDEAVKPTEEWLTLCLNEEEKSTTDKVKHDSCIRIPWRDIARKELLFNMVVGKKIDTVRMIICSDFYDQSPSLRKTKNAIPGLNVLLNGPSGTGKSELVRQMAIESERDIVEVEAATIRAKYYGETERHLKSLFDEYAKVCRTSKRKPILLFNEADALFGKRRDPQGGAPLQVENNIQTILLNYLEKHEGIVVLTTNRPESFDPAFSRRFLFDIELESPDLNTRKMFLKEWYPQADGMSLDQIATDHEFTPAELLNFNTYFDLIRQATNENLVLETQLDLFLKQRGMNPANKPIGFGSTQ